ncbi:MAG: PTS system mannose/fructose/sorbose family transporter subunit IID [Gemmatimonadota bacterium]
MTVLPRRVLAATLLRSFAIQGSWNYRTLIGCGFAFALLPVLRTIYNGRPDEYQAAVQRHAAVFNSHPYLAPMALGAVSVLESSESPEVVERFKSAVRGSLGSLGDRLIWAGFRPLCVLLALSALMLGASWFFVTGGFLVLYNVGHVATRVWALRFGLRHGKRLGEQLRTVPVERVQHVMQSVGAFLLGTCLVLLLAGRPFTQETSLPWTLAGIVAAAIGMSFGARCRMPVVLAISAAALISLAVGVLA